MKFISNEQGKCPLCNSMNLSYDTMEIDDGLGNSCYYPWHCDDCGADGKEWYYVDFSEIIANTSDGDVTGSEEGVCPECGEGINYLSSEPDGESLGYEFECPACGVSGTEWYNLDFDSHTIDGHEDEVIDVMTEAIDYRNDKYTVTTAEDPKEDREYYGKNMTKRDKVRSFDQAKRNLDRMEKDPRVTQGQAVDQISFDDALNTDLAYYKHNKDMARLDKEQGNDFWTDEHNKTAKEFADKIRAKHTAKTENEIIDVSDRLCKVQEDTQPIKLSDKMKSIDIKKPDDDIDGNETVDVKGKYGNMKSIKVDKDKLSVTPSIANQINKKQEELETDDIDETEEEEPDIDFNDTISLLDIALSEIPVVGVEDWGKDNELKFVADTKALFEGLKPYEEEIPRYFYDNADRYDWSNGVDEYLETIVGIDPENDGESNNTYNWNAPVTHNVEFTTYETENGCYYKASIHRAGDVRGNYTTEFLLKFDSIDACYEQIMESCMENCSNEIEVDGKRYGIDPNFFGETVTIYDFETQESYDDVYCTDIDDLKKIIAENKQDEIVDENFKGKKVEESSGYAEFLYNQKKHNDYMKEQDEIKRAQKISMLQDRIDHRRDSLANLGLRYFGDGNVHRIFTLSDNKLYDKCTINESDVLEKLNKIDAFLSEVINKRKAEGTTE